LILSGVFDRHPDLRLLLAHSGGALPQLSSRLASCVDHDPVVARRLKHDARFYLGKLYFDAVAYGPEELGFVSDVISRSRGYGTGEQRVEPDRTLGSKRMVHQFFFNITKFSSSLFLSSTDVWYGPPILPSSEGNREVEERCRKSRSNSLRPWLE
jgi:aminocarboxymuconate-semialdehyde decarboxylase